MNVVFITEGGRDIGFGHITRCLAIAQAFQEKGVQTRFVVNADASVRGLLHGQSYVLGDWLHNRESLIAPVSHSAAVAVLDSYKADKSFYEYVSALFEAAVFIDDYKRLAYPRGIVINGTPGAARLRYPRRKGVQYLLGERYSFLRKEFWSVPKKRIRKEAKNIMVTMGGMDDKNMTVRILGSLSQEYPFLKKTVIVGKAFKNIPSIRKAADKATELIFSPDAAAMKKAMRGSDIAISAGGQTLNELAKVGVATVAIAVADNQRINIAGWKQKGFIEDAGCYKDKDVFSRIKKCVQALLPYKAREARSLNARKALAHNGPRNIVRSVLEYG